MKGIKKKIIIIIIFLLLIFSNIIVLGNNIKINKDQNESNNSEDFNSYILTDKDIAKIRQKGESEGWTFKVGPNSATNRTMEQLCGFKIPENNQNYSDNESNNIFATTEDLPEKWDWREHNGVTPIRNQGMCGSCWAFGTTAPLESAIKINAGIDVDLSEQWLVSCNRNGWGCQGGYWAHAYYYDKEGFCGGVGAVLENNFPYCAFNEPCNGPYPHDYFLVDTDGDGKAWNYIRRNSVAPVEQLKQAIYNFGPISAAVHVDDAFKAYKSGVFNSDNQWGPVNHAISLVGWDDTQGSEGVWILRNSWGAGWGENGYMRIGYGCNRVGYDSIYIELYGTMEPVSDLEANVTIEIHKISNEPLNGKFSSIDPVLFGKPEWYYTLKIMTAFDGATEYTRYNKYINQESPGNWFEYVHQYTWNVDHKYTFVAKSSKVDINIKLMEYDEIDQCDLADVSCCEGGGLFDSTSDKRGAIYFGRYDILTNTLTGDKLKDDGIYKTTVGDGNNNAKIWFRITDDYN